ncbi:ERMIN protein, partial [Hemiprocne comata]|nr:ERMIN protein [Hemiprocne comata]
MTEEVPAASTMPECNGSIPLEKGPCQVVGVIDEIANSVGTVPYRNAETSPDAPLAKGNQEENRNSLTEDVRRGDLDGEKQCEGNVPAFGKQSSELAATWPDATPGAGRAGAVPVLPLSLCVPAGPGRAAGSGQPEPGAAGTPGADSTGDVQEEAEEEDTEEDEVQVIEMKKENGEASPLQQQDSGKDVASAPTSPGCNAQAEKPGEQPSLGKKNDISRHSYSRYNTISYRRIRKGNTKQRIDEFESMMHL